MEDGLIFKIGESNIKLKNTFVHIDETSGTRLTRSLSDITDKVANMSRKASFDAMSTPSDQPSPSSVLTSDMSCVPTTSFSASQSITISRMGQRRHSAPSVPLSEIAAPVAAEGSIGSRLISRRGSAPAALKPGVLGESPSGFRLPLLLPPLGGYTVPPMQGTSPTTAMLRNLPSRVTLSCIVNLLFSRGFGGHFDFIYAPLDFNTGGALGYFFINFINFEVVQRFALVFQNFLLPGLLHRPCEVSLAKVQGFQANLNLIISSGSLPRLPEGWRPLILKDGAYSHVNV